MIKTHRQVPVAHNTGPLEREAGVGYYCEQALCLGSRGAGVEFRNRESRQGHTSAGSGLGCKVWQSGRGGSWSAVFTRLLNTPGFTLGRFKQAHNAIAGRSHQPCLISRHASPGDSLSRIKTVIPAENRLHSNMQHRLSLRASRRRRPGNPRYRGYGQGFQNTDADTGYLV